MRSATDFLPAVMSTFMNLATSTEPYFGIGQDVALRDFSASGHLSFSASLYQPALGRLAPYFERDCLRSFTPAVSRLPRTMW